MKRLVIHVQGKTLRCAPTERGQKLSLEKLAEDLQEGIPKWASVSFELEDGSYMVFGKDLIQQAIFQVVDTDANSIGS